MKYRIVKSDRLNWRLESWSEGGKNPATGKLGKPGWRGMESYHPSLRQAAKSLLDHAAGDALLAGEATSILEALELAERRVSESVVENSAKVAGSPVGAR